MNKRAFLLGIFLAAFIPSEAKAQGTLVLEILHNDGRRAPSTVEIRQGNRLVRTVNCYRGECQMGLPAGSYQARAFKRDDIPIIVGYQEDVLLFEGETGGARARWQNGTPFGAC